MVKISFVTIAARTDYPYMGRPDLHIFEPTMVSLKAQTMLNFEWIIVDHLYDERKDYFKNIKLPFRVKHVPARPNVWHDIGMCGICTQYNKGIIYADGELLIFMGEGYMYISEFCEKLWARYKQGYYPFAWYFYDNTFTPKIQIEPIPGWRKARPEDTEASPAPYNISGYIGQNITIEHRPIVAFKGGVHYDYPAPWDWWFSCSSTPMEAMLKINGFDQRFDGDQMLSDCDVGSRLQLAGYNKFAMFRDLFAIRVRTDKNIWNSKLVKVGPSIKCNLPLIYWSRAHNHIRANDYEFTDEDIKWIKDEYCGQQCVVREQCKKERPWQYPFEYKEGTGLTFFELPDDGSADCYIPFKSSEKYKHLPKNQKELFDYWRTHQVMINLTEERQKRISGDKKYQEGTFI